MEGKRMKERNRRDKRRKKDKRKDKCKMNGGQWKLKKNDKNCGDRKVINKVGREEELL